MNTMTTSINCADIRRMASYFLGTTLLVCLVSCSNPKEGSVELKNDKVKTEEPVNTETNGTATAAPKIQIPDTYPLFPGCTQKKYDRRRACSQSKLIDMLHQVVKYPDMRLDENPAGIVIHSFIVQEDGTMSDLKLEKSLSTQCDEAARDAIVELFEVAGPWEPATLDGKKVAARYSLPIQFQKFE